MQKKPTIVIAPVGLQPALLVLLQAHGISEPVVCATTIHSLAPTLSPRLLIYALTASAALTDVQTLKQLWPAAGLLVLVAEPEQQPLAQAAGADSVLLSGVSPHRLLNAIAVLYATAP